MRDGSVRDIRFVTRSGSFAFDLSAQGAIEAAGNAGVFGPLPDGWDADVLPVSFYFKPVPNETIARPDLRRCRIPASRLRIPPRSEDGVRVGVDYQPGVRPGW